MADPVPGNGLVQVGFFRPEVSVGVFVGLDPFPGFFQTTEEVADGCTLGFDGVGIGGDAGQTRHQATRGDDRLGAGEYFLLRDVGFPHRKRIDAALWQRGGGVDRHQFDELDVVFRQARFFQRAQGQLLAPGAGPVGDFLAFEVFDGLAVEFLGTSRAIVSGFCRETPINLTGAPLAARKMNPESPRKPRSSAPASSPSATGAADWKCFQSTLYGASFNTPDASTDARTL